MKSPDMRMVRFNREKNQYLIARGTASPLINPENVHLVFLLESLLGRGIGSELWKLRERDMLAYQVDSFSDMTRNGGIFMVYLKSNPEQRLAAHQKLNRQIMTLCRDGLDSRAFLAHKNYAMADFLRLVESKRTKAFYLAFFESQGPGYEFLERIPGAMNGIRSGEFQNFLQQVLDPEQNINLIIGPEILSETASDKPPASAEEW
jgi:predicted Zn-dependent peptidase